jgi:hypothetical protein
MTHGVLKSPGPYGTHGYHLLQVSAVTPPTLTAFGEHAVMWLNTTSTYILEKLSEIFVKIHNKFFVNRYYKIGT